MLIPSGYRWVGLLLAVLVLLSGSIPYAAAQDDDQPVAPSYTPIFEPGDCVTRDLQEFDEPGYELECGYLIVPEDRSHPDQAVVRLPVAIFRTQNPDSASDPLIYLAGGGGHNHLAGAVHYLHQVGDAILEKRDFIQYNQRGARYTEPELDCPGYVGLLWTLAKEPVSVEEQAARQAEHLVGCQRDLTEQGVNLAMYNSATNAADANDLRIALGYEQANYYGTSYGTRLGLTLIRDFPDGVRSIILDSVYPPQVDYYAEYTPNGYRALKLIFDSCAADAACNAQYPALEDTFLATVALLDEQPVTRRLSGGTVQVNGGLFLEAVDLLTYSADSIRVLPGLITAAHARNVAPLDGIVNALLSDLPGSINWAMFYAMQCQEEVPFGDRDQVQALVSDVPSAYADFWSVRFADIAFGICGAWTLPISDPAEAEPVVSEVPALVLAGEFDPITSPAWSFSAAEYLPNSFFFEFPGQSHGVMRAASCGLDIGLQFLDNPTVAPDAACIDMLPAVTFD